MTTATDTIPVDIDHLRRDPMDFALKWNALTLRERERYAWPEDLSDLDLRELNLTATALVGHIIEYTILPDNVAKALEAASKPRPRIDYVTDAKDNATSTCSCGWKSKPGSFDQSRQLRDHLADEHTIPGASMEENNLFLFINGGEVRQPNPDDNSQLERMREMFPYFSEEEITRLHAMQPRMTGIPMSTINVLTGLESLSGMSIGRYFGAVK